MVWKAISSITLMMLPIRVAEPEISPMAATICSSFSSVWRKLPASEVITSAAE